MTDQQSSKNKEVIRMNPDEQARIPIRTNQVELGVPERADQPYFDVNIRKVVNGCIVTVGCKTFVFNDTDKAVKEIGAYLENPVATIKRYKEEYKF